MGRPEGWFAEESPRPAAEDACRLARGRFWRDERARLIGVHPDFPDAAYRLGIGEELAHALLLILSRLPAAERLPFASAFFERSVGTEAPSPFDHRLRLVASASIALLVVDLAESRVLEDERILDLLEGAAQGDDLTLTSGPALDHLRKAIARIRFDPELEDDADPRAAAAIAVVEVLDPSSETIALKEILARAAYATVESRPRSRTLGFLLEVDRILADAARPT